MAKKLEGVARASLSLEFSYNSLSKSFAALTESIQALDVTERGFPKHRLPPCPCKIHIFFPASFFHDLIS